jgi:hypothetical protein
MHADDFLGTGAMLFARMEKEDQHTVPRSYLKAWRDLAQDGACREGATRSEGSLDPGSRAERASRWGAMMFAPWSRSPRRPT